MNESRTQTVIPHYMNSTDAISVPVSYPSISLNQREAVMGCNNYYTKYDMLERDVGIISVEHCYARPITWTAESTFYKPTKTIFMFTNTNRRRSSNPLAPVHHYEDIIDVETVPPDPPVLYDKEKAVEAMEECDKFAQNVKPMENDEPWEDSVSRMNWTPVQNRLFSGIVSILNSAHLGCLAYANSHNEPVKRRLIINKGVKRMRHLLASVFWDTRLLQWLHHLLLDHLSTSYLSNYLDMLQCLKAKLPSFVDKIVYGPSSTTRTGGISNESLFPLLKNVWDPYANYVPPVKPRNIPAGAVIIMCPSAPSSLHPNHLKRQSKWMRLLGSLATTVNVHTSLATAGTRMTMANCADQLLAVTRTKIQEVRTEMPGRPIILAGCNVGAALALQIAQVEHPVCVICIGFSLLTADGKRGEPEDTLLDLQSPVVFVIGQCASKSTQEDVEDLRERLRVENGLIVVGAADDYLRLSNKKKIGEGVTQDVVDRMIVDQIGDFISGLQTIKHKDRKRVNSTGSSIDSEPPSPTPRITRPVGRPPGSKGRPKWTPIPGIPSPPPPPSPSLTSTSHNTSTPSSPSNTPKPSDCNSNLDDSSASKYITYNKLNYTGSTLSNLLQGGYNTNPYQSSRMPCGIKVLENVRLNPNSKLANQNRPMDLSKITVISSATTKAPGNVVFMPDGKMKTISTSYKNSGGTFLLQSVSTICEYITKYVTSKKQLIGRKPQSFASPGNLNIMDLPIIFADDNVIPDGTSRTDLPMAEMIPTQTKTASNPVGKFVFVNKQIPGKTMATTTLKRPIVSNPSKLSTILISRNEPKSITNPSSTITTELKRKVIDDDPMDLENKLIATTIPKPDYVISNLRTSSDKELQPFKQSESTVKRSAPEEDETEASPSKLIKND